MDPANRSSRRVAAPQAHVPRSQPSAPVAPHLQTVQHAHAAHAPWPAVKVATAIPSIPASHLSTSPTTTPTHQSCSMPRFAKATAPAKTTHSPPPTSQRRRQTPAPATTAPRSNPPRIACTTRSRQAAAARAAAQSPVHAHRDTTTHYQARTTSPCLHHIGSVNQSQILAPAPQSLTSPASASSPSPPRPCHRARTHKSDTPPAAAAA